MADGNTTNRLFLKKILYRIDFQFITEKMQEEVYAYIAERYGDYFAEQSQEMANEIDVAIDMSSLEHSRLNKKSQPIFVFSQPKTNDCDGRVCKLGRTFFWLELDLRQSTMGIPYFDWVADIISYLNQFPIFKITRVGLRKFNNFYILHEDVNKLKEIFKIDYLAGAECEGFTLDNFTHAQLYDYEKLKLRFSRNYSTGSLSNPARRIENQPAHLIAFDFDLFTASEEMLELIKKDASATLQSMNATVYSFFQSIVCDAIVHLLNTGDNLSDYKIIPF